MSNEHVMSISGTVHYLIKILLSPNSTLHVSLQDVTPAAPVKELAQQVIPHAETAGLDFNLTYAAADVLPGHSYGITARIETNGEVIFATTKPHRVELGVNHLRPEDVVVRNVRKNPDSNA
ncbi:MAG: YbaY family lipoprotein [Pseudomonas sp.]